MTIRPTITADLPLLSEYWYDRMALLQQMRTPLRLLPDARSRWEAAANDWLADSDLICLTYTRDDEAAGAIIGGIERNQPGIAPEHIGRVRQLVIDLHTPRPQRGVGSALLTALNDHFREAGVTRTIAEAPVTLAVEQAFWRGVGAKNSHDIFWMDL